MTPAELAGAVVASFMRHAPTDRSDIEIAVRYEKNLVVIMARAPEAYAGESVSFAEAANANEYEAAFLGERLMANLYRYFAKRVTR